MFSYTVFIAAAAQMSYLHMKEEMERQSWPGSLTLSDRCERRSLFLLQTNHFQRNQLPIHPETHQMNMFFNLYSSVLQGWFIKKKEKECIIYSFLYFKQQVTGKLNGI